MEANSEHYSGAGRVLIVDDDEAVAGVYERILRHAGFQPTIVREGEAALRLIESDPPDVVLLDVIMPGLNGFDVCRRVRQEAATRLLPVVLISGHSERDKRIAGANVGADDFLTKPVDTQELVARVRSLTRLKRYTDDLDSATSIIMMLAAMVESRDGYSVGHCHRMANYAAALGRHLGLSEADLQTLHRGGFLHDIGMLAIPDSVLRKPGALEPEEYELIKSHTIIGDNLCAHLRSLQPVRAVVRHHHERLDGSGYPDGLKGDQIPLVAQIIGLVDAYDALTTRRAYQHEQTHDGAFEVLRDHVRLGWRRADLTESFIALIQRGTLHSFALASQGGAGA